MIELMILPTFNETVNIPAWVNCSEAQDLNYSLAEVRTRP